MTRMPLGASSFPRARVKEFYRSFGRGVGCLAGSARKSPDRRYIENRSAALAEKQRDRRPAGKEHGSYIGLKQCVPLRQGHVPAAAHMRDSGVIDQNLQTGFLRQKRKKGGYEILPGRCLPEQ